MSILLLFKVFSKDIVHSVSGNWRTKTTDREANRTHRNAE